MVKFLLRGVSQRSAGRGGKISHCIIEFIMLKRYYFIGFLLLSACNSDESNHFNTTPPKQLTQNTGKDEDPTVIQAQDGKFYLAYFSDQDGNSEIWMTKSSNGTSWETPWKIIADPAGDFYPQLFQGIDGTFYLTWFRIAFDTNLQNYTFHVWFARSDDAINWEGHKQLSEAVSTFNWVPSITEDQNGDLLVAYVSGRLDANKEIYLIRSDDKGVNWSSPTRITQNALSDDYPFIMQNDNGEYLLTWSRVDESFGAFNPTAENLLVTSTDGLTWSAPQVISPPDPTTDFTDILPHLCSETSGNKISVAWTSDRSGVGGDIFSSPLDQAGSNTFIQLTQGGTSYSCRLTPTQTKSIYMMVWVSSANELTKPDIFYRFIKIE